MDTPNPPDDGRACHYCTALNTVSQTVCSRCGMPLPAIRFDHRRRLLRRFTWAFVAVVLFCAVMVWYLPR